MTAVQQLYRDTPAMKLQEKFSSFDRATVDELNLIHRIQIIRMQKEFYTKNPNGYWVEKGEALNSLQLQDLILEYEEKYGKFELND